MAIPILSIALFSDPKVADGNPTAAARAIAGRDDAIAQGCDIIVWAGDCGYVPSVSEHNTVASIVAGSTVPLYTVPGNHDVVSIDTTPGGNFHREYSLAQYKSLVRNPPNYAVTHNGVRLIFCYVPAVDPDGPAGTFSVTDTGYENFLAAELDAIEEDDSFTHTVVVGHHPTYYGTQLAKEPNSSINPANPAAIFHTRKSVIYLSGERSDSWYLWPEPTEHYVEYCPNGNNGGQCYYRLDIHPNVLRSRRRHFATSTYSEEKLVRYTRDDPSLIALTTEQPTDAPGGTPPDEEPEPIMLPPTGILKLAQGAFHNPLLMTPTPDNRLCVLDQLADASRVVLRLEIDGTVLSTTPVPSNTHLAWMDSAGTVYAFFNDSTTVNVISPGNVTTTRTLPIKILDRNVGLVTMGGVEYLFLAPHRTVSTSYRVRLSDWNTTQFTLSEVPPAFASSNARCRSIQVRANGHLYILSAVEGRMWHYDENGTLLEKIGGGGPQPPARSLPAETLGSFVTVAPDGDLYWSQASYGSILRLAADNSLGSRFDGIQGMSGPDKIYWLPSVNTIPGAALVGERFFVINGTDKNIVSFPLSIVEDGASDVTSVDPRWYGLNYKVVSPSSPAKLFTGEAADLVLSFATGFRTLTELEVSYVLRDYGRNVLDSQTLSVTLPAEGVGEHALTLSLPRQDWYELDTALLVDGQVAMERTAYLSRVAADERFPLPGVGVQDSNGNATNAALGLGLQRFSASVATLLSATIVARVAQAEALGLPYIIQIEPKADCTPEKVAQVIAAYPLSSHPHLRGLEIMNEPTIQGMNWSTYLNTYLIPCFNAARAADPDYKVMGPTNVTIDMAGFYTPFINAGGLNYVDHVSVHTYLGHNSLDFEHFKNSIKALRAAIDAAGHASKELYITEKGQMGNPYLTWQHVHWHGLVTFREYEVNAASGIPPERFHYFYPDSHGFSGYASFIRDGNGEMYPAGTFLRVRAQRLWGRAHVAVPVEFAVPHKWMLSVNRYNGETSDTKDVFVLMNTGSTAPVPLKTTLPPGSQLYDHGGNALATSAGERVLSITQLPLYLEVPRNAILNFTTETFTNNLALSATVEVDDSLASVPATKAKLSNGVLDGFFAAGVQNAEAFVGNRNHLPLDVVQRFSGEKTVSAWMLFSSYADNNYCAPLKFSVALETAPGVWTPIANINERAQSHLLVWNDGSNSRTTDYLAPWFWKGFCAPQAALAIRFRFESTTYGHFPTQELHQAVWTQEFGKPLSNTELSPRVDIREAMVWEQATPLLPLPEPLPEPEAEPEEPTGDVTARLVLQGLSTLAQATATAQSFGGKVQFQVEATDGTTTWEATVNS